MEPKILYEDEFLLALDKPSGLLVHGDGRSEEPTLVDWVRRHRPELEEVGEPQVLQDGQTIKRPGVVHRLDKDTSGVLLIAKSKESHAFLKEQFQNRKVEKVYNAIVWGSFSPDKMEGLIDKPIGRSASDFRRWSAEYGAKGEMREAVTQYTVLAQNPLDGAHGGKAYLEVRPKTGRTHQIRVHLKSISHPVLCDKLYAPGKLCDGSSTCLGFSRLALHALSIKLELPDHSHIKIESELPREFEEVRGLL